MKAQKMLFMRQFYRLYESHLFLSKPNLINIVGHCQVLYLKISGLFQSRKLKKITIERNHNGLLSFEWKFGQ